MPPGHILKDGYSSRMVVCVACSFEPYHSDVLRIGVSAFVRDPLLVSCFTGEGSVARGMHSIVWDGDKGRVVCRDQAYDIHSVRG